MILAYLTLITALSISAVAIYYSVAGLMTIFAAAAIPIMIMGGVLEVGKLVTAVWLHKYWSRATWWLKTYLTTAVLILMFITSMGIFGYLSKAHIEQTASANEGIAQLERVENEIARNENIIERAERKIRDLESSGTGASNQIQEQIDREQLRIDSAYKRIQPAIQEQNSIIQNVTALFQQELDRVDEELARLQGFIDNNEIEKAQAMVGTAVDGDYGPNTARAFTQFQEAKRAERSEWLQRIQDAAGSATVVAAREEIARLRAGAEEQIAQSNELINNLRSQLKSNNGNDLQTALNEQSETIRLASQEVEQLLDTKFAIESEYRKLEAEVGPVKYIAEFIYGETADKNLLEEAVRWVIIVIIFVFDPLAVLLLIAAQYTFEFRRKELEDDGGESLRQDYERARAQRIVDNVPPVFESPARDPSPTDDNMGDVLPEDDPSHTDATDTAVEQDQVQLDETDQGAVNDLGPIETNAVTEFDRADDNGGDTSNGMAVAETKVEDLITTEELASEYTKSKKKTPIEYSEELNREDRYKEKEKSEIFQVNKTEWKKNNPSSTLKHYKNLYIKGVIDELPWERTRTESEGYQQNAEQNESSLFNKLRRTKQD